MRASGFEIGRAVVGVLEHSLKPDAGLRRVSAGQRIAHYAGNEQGTIAVLFALLLLPILGIVFGGIDYSRAMSVQSQLQSAAEAAAGTALSRLPEGREAAEAAFDAAFRANLPDDLKDQPYALDVTANQTAIEVEIKASVPTTLVALLGLSKLQVAAETKASLPKPLKTAHRQGFKSGLDAIPGAAGARVRAEYDNAVRNSGGAATGMPSSEELAKAQAQMREVMRALGVSGRMASPQDLPDPKEVERMQQQIARELSRLRF